MRITIIALGSRGDVLPYATLGQALQTAGHDVLMATYQGFEQMVRDRGLAYLPVQGDAESLLATGAGIDLAESGRNPLRAWRAIMRSFGAMARAYGRDLAPLAERPADLIINQLPGGLYGSDLAEKLGIPMILAAVMPLARTGAFPMLAFPSGFGAIPGYNRLTYLLAEQLVWQGYRTAINEWRQYKLGLSPLRWYGAFGQLYRKPVPVLNGFSAHVVSRPADWGDHIHVTGYWFPQENEWQPPPDLERFLQSGPAPVFVGFGSMPVRQPEPVTQLIVEALHMSGQRGVLQAGWAGLKPDVVPPDIFPLDYAPFDWLFPQMRAVIHHGGSGTTHVGLRSGVPAMVVPFLFDQFFWGRRLNSLGVGPQPLPFKRLTAQRLATAISQMVADEEMRERAAELGRKIRAEQGLAQAVSLVERYGRQP